MTSAWARSGATCAWMVPTSSPKSAATPATMVPIEDRAAARRHRHRPAAGEGELGAPFGADDDQRRKPAIEIGKESVGGLAELFGGLKRRRLVGEGLHLGVAVAPAPPHHAIDARL